MREGEVRITSVVCYQCFVRKAIMLIIYYYSYTPRGVALVCVKEAAGLEHCKTPK